MVRFLEAFPERGLSSDKSCFLSDDHVDSAVVKRFDDLTASRRAPYAGCTKYKPVARIRHAHPTQSW